MENWFEIALKYEGIDSESGKNKKFSEKYFIDAATFGEAEERITGEMAKKTSSAIDIAAIKKAKCEVSKKGIGTAWYKCKIAIVEVDENSGKEKTVTNVIYIQGDSVKEARENIEAEISGWLATAEIDGVEKSKIIEVFDYTGQSDFDVAYQHEKNKLAPILRDILNEEANETP